MAILVSPYDTAQTALTDAIIFANDAGSPAGINGNVLNPTTNPAVLPAFKERWRYLQHRLISAGVDTFTKDQNVYCLQASGTSNPRVLMILTYNGFFNGQFWSGPNITAPAWSNVVTYSQGFTVSYNNGYYIALPNANPNLNQEPDIALSFWQPFSNIGPALPADLLKPMEIWECQTGGNAWVPMKQCPDSLNVDVIQPRFRMWSFENNQLYLPGASQQNDLRIKYLAMAPDINDWNSPLFVRGCATALAYLALDQLAGARGGPMAEVFKVRAEEAINQIVNQTVRKQSYAQFVRRPFHGGRYGRRSGV